TGRTTPYEKQYVRKDGSRWWALFAATRLNEHEGVEFVLDISAEKRAEEERATLLEQERTAHAQAMAALEARDTLFASVTHDLRNPLAGVKGFAQLLKRRLARTDSPVPEWLTEGLEQIERSANATVRLADELLDLERHRETGRLELR